MTMQQTSSVVRLTGADLDWATALLGAAFLNEPPMSHLFTGARRESQTREFVRCACAYALGSGEVYTTSTRQGVALWLPPGKTTISLLTMARTGLLLAPFRLGLTTLARVLGFMEHMDTMHKQTAPAHHYYLLMLGVHPQAQGKGVGKILMNHLLERAEQESMPVYLETQSERNLDLYRRFGFNVAIEDSVPGLTGLKNWGMLRRAS